MTERRSVKEADDKVVAEDQVPEDDDRVAEDEVVEGDVVDDGRARGRTASRARGRTSVDHRRLSTGEAGRLGLQEIVDLTGKEPEGITGVARAEDGWLVTVEVIEDRRIPSSTDLLATYEVEVDGDGELASYRRVRRYARGRGD